MDVMLGWMRNCLNMNRGWGGVDEEYWIPCERFGERICFEHRVARERGGGGKQEQRGEDRGGTREGVAQLTAAWKREVRDASHGGAPAELPGRRGR